MRIKRVQQFYADQMESYGYGRKTFRFETDANGNAVVHHNNRENENSHYRTKAARCLSESKHIQTRNTILVVYIDYGKKLIGKGTAGVTYSGKRILIPAFGQGRNVLAHELGHAFNLPHDFRDGSYIMSYGPGTPNRISACAARWLDVHPYFNPDQVKTEQPGHIKRLSSAMAYPPNDVHHFFEVTDPDGLHTIRFLHGPLQVYGCQSISGEKEIVKFSTTTLELKNNKVNVQMVDINGDVKHGGWHSFEGKEPYMVLDISTGTAGVDDGLIGYWAFDEANGQYGFDTSGNDNYAKLGSGATLKFNGGQIGGALLLEQSKGAYVSNGEDLINGLSAFTLSLWVKSDNVNTDKGFIFHRNPNNKDEIFSMRYDAKGSKGNGTNVIKANIATTRGSLGYESASNVQTTEWQHIALTWRSGRELALYINGVLDQPTFNSLEKQGEVAGVNKLLIGKGSRDRRGSWDGLIDEVRLYNRALNEREIMDLAFVGRATNPFHGIALTGICDLKPETINANVDVNYVLTVKTLTIQKIQ